MTVWHLDVDRVRIIGAGVHGMDAGELRGLVEAAVQQALEATPLPAGRTVRVSVEMRVTAPRSAAAIASAVARGVSVAAGGRVHG